MGNLLQSLFAIFTSRQVLLALTAAAVAALWGFSGLQSIWKDKIQIGSSWIVISFLILTVAMIGFIVDSSWIGASISGVSLLGGILVVVRYRDQAKRRKAKIPPES